MQKVAPKDHETLSNHWSHTAAQPLLITILVTAMMTSILTVAQTLGPGRPWLVLVWLCFFAALEGVLTTLWLSQPERRQLNRFAYRAAEFLLLTLITRVVSWALFGDFSLPEMGLEGVWRQPWLLFGSPFFLISLLLVLVSWQFALLVTAIFHSLRVDTAEVTYYSLPPKAREAANRPLGYDRSALVRAFFRQWVWGGIIIAVCAALTTFDLAEGWKTGSFAMTRLGLRPGILGALLVYFFSGFLLLSQARLAALSARWLTNSVQKGARVERSWYRQALWILLLFALLAAFLPIGSTSAIGRIIELLIGGIIYLASLVMFLFFALLAMFLSLFGFSEETTPLAEAPPPEPLEVPPAPPPAAEAASQPSLLFGTILWFFLSVAIIGAALYFIRDREVPLPATKKIGTFWTAFISWLQTLWLATTGQLADIGTQLRERLRVERAPAKEKKPRWRYIRVNALSPRAKVRYFYLSTIRRAEAQGLRRERSQTPHEFAEELKTEWSEAGEDMEALTAAFAKARYSSQPISEAEIEPLKRQWKRLRAYLKRGRS